MNSFVNRSLVLLLTLAAAAACKDDNTNNLFRFDFSTAPAAFDTTGRTKVSIETDFYYFVIAAGTGEVCTAVDPVRLYYTLRRKDTGKVVSSTYVNGNTTAPNFMLGNPIYVNSYTGFSTPDFLGLRRGVPGMRVGEKRTLMVPQEYGIGLATRYQLDVELVGIIK